MAKKPVTGSSSVILPRVNLAGKARAQRPGSDQDKGQAIRNNLKQYVASAINAVRTRSDINEIIRILAREDGIFSASANAMTALAAGSGFRLAGYDSTGRMDTAVMAAAYSVLDSFDTLHDYSIGFNDKDSIASLLATLQMDVILTGGCGLELILDKQFGPERLVPVGYSTIGWESDGRGGRYPTQDDGDINLDLPTVYIGELNKNADEGYAVSLLRPGLSQVFQYSEFLEDLHRSVNRTGHSRLIAKLNQEAVKSLAPQEVKSDPVKMAAFYNQVKGSVESSLTELEPEDALVSFDTVEFDVKDIGGAKSDYSSLLTTLGNLLGVSLKTPASVSGLRTEGGQSLSNAETLTYLKTVSAIRAPVEQVLSRALTLAIRLLGVDGHVKFVFNNIDLRPDTELEAYRSTKLKRILSMLSYGLITDAEACFELGVRPQGLIKELAGTGFYTNTGDETTTSGERISSTGRSLNPGTPEQEGD